MFVFLVCLAICDLIGWEAKKKALCHPVLFMVCTLKVSHKIFTLCMHVKSYIFGVTQSKSRTHCSLLQAEKAPCLDPPPHQTDRVWV